MLKEHEYISEKEHGFGTLVDIAAYMGKHGIPADAQIVYAGCGSHSIAFEWECSEPVSDPNSNPMSISDRIFSSHAG